MMGWPMFTTRHRVPRLTCDQYDALVYAWNDKPHRERLALTTTCSEEGHDWTEASFSEPRHPTYVCRRCLAYDLQDR